MEQELTIGGKISDIILEEGESYIVGGPLAEGRGTISSTSPLRTRRTTIPKEEVKSKVEVVKSPSKSKEVEEVKPKSPSSKSKEVEEVKPKSKSKEAEEVKPKSPSSKSKEVEEVKPKSPSKSKEVEEVKPKSPSKSKEVEVVKPKSKSKELEEVKPKSPSSKSKEEVKPKSSSKSKEVEEVKPKSKVVKVVGSPSKLEEEAKPKSKEPEEEKEEEDLFLDIPVLKDGERVLNGYEYRNIYDIIPSDEVDKLCQKHKISPYWLSEYLIPKNNPPSQILNSDEFKEYKNKYPVTKWVPARFDLQKYKGSISKFVGSNLPESNDPSVVRPSKPTSSSYHLDTGHREYFRRYLNSGSLEVKDYKKGYLVDDLFHRNAKYDIIKGKLGNMDNKSIDLFEGSSEDLEKILISEEILSDEEKYDPAFYKAYICLLLYRHSGGLGIEKEAHPVSQEFIDYITYFHKLSPIDYIYLGEKLVNRPLTKKEFFCLLSRGFDHPNHEEFSLLDDEHQRLISNFLSDHDYDDYAYSKNSKIVDMLSPLDISSLQKDLPSNFGREFLIKNFRDIVSGKYKTLFKDKIDGVDYNFYIKSKDLPTLNDMWKSMDNTDRVYLSSVPPKCKNVFNKTGYPTVRIGTKKSYECFSLDKLNDHLIWDENKENLGLKLPYTINPMNLDNTLVLDLINIIELLDKKYESNEEVRHILDKLREKLKV